MPSRHVTSYLLTLFKKVLNKGGRQQINDIIEKSTSEAGLLGYVTNFSNSVFIYKHHAF